MGLATYKYTARLNENERESSRDLIEVSEDEEREVLMR